jgi:2-C-methyl-D-erythritol 4-phosphate cytidylyltransferase
VVVVPEEHVEATQKLTDAVAACIVTAGGATRRASVARGLDRIGDAARVVVHDAARPFLTEALLRRVVDALDEHEAAIAAEPVEETLKTVEGDTVVETIDRARVWRAQTPQAFRTETLRRAHAGARGSAATDDAQLVELSGGTVAVVRGDRRNIKVTFEDDFAIAESLAAAAR